MPKFYKIGNFLCQETTEEEYYEEVRERELSFIRDSEFFQKRKIELRENGNFSEDDKLENFILEEWLEWKEKEKQRIESLERAVERKLEK